MSNNISQLAKGLIFNAKLDEWHPDIDLVSGARSTNTDVFPVLDKHGNGRRSMSYDGINDYTALPSLAPFGTSDFSVVMKVKINSLLAEYGLNIIIAGESNSFNLYVDASGHIVTSQSNVGSNTASTTALQLNTDYTIAYTRTGTIGRYYINGIADNSITDNRNYDASSTRVGNNNPFNLNGSISMTRVFNYSLDSEQVAYYSKPENPIKWVDRGATGANLVTNGDFSNGINYWTSTGNFSIVSGVLVHTGASTTSIYQYLSIVEGKVYDMSLDCVLSGGGVNYATYGLGNGQYLITGKNVIGTTADSVLGIFYDVWGDASIDNVSVIQRGCLLDLNAEGMTAYYWYDRTNSLTATNSGCTLVKPVASNLGAMSFAKSTSVVVFPDSNDLTLPITGFTISGRFRIEKTNTAYGIICKHYTEGQREYALNTTSDGRLRVTLFQNGSYESVTYFTSEIGSIVQDKDYCFAFTYNYNTGTFYIDGNKIPITYKTDGGGGFINFNNTTSPTSIGFIGVDNVPPASKISNIRIHNRILSAEEISTLSQIS